MRKSKRQMSESAAYKLLRSCDYMTLSTTLENGYPYCIPLNYVLDNNKVYFHCAMEGQKNDSFKNNSKVCISVVEKSTIIAKKYTTAFSSVTAFGKIYPVEDIKEKEESLISLIKKFSPEFYDKGVEYVKKAQEKTAVYAIEIEHITGKSSLLPTK